MYYVTVNGVVRHTFGEMDTAWEAAKTLVRNGRTCVALHEIRVGHLPRCWLVNEILRRADEQLPTLASLRGAFSQPHSPA